MGSEKIGRDRSPNVFSIYLHTNIHSYLDSKAFGYPKCRLIGNCD